LVSSSFLRHYDETKTLLCSIPHICLIGADGKQFDSLWESLFPTEQARIARLLIERVTVSADGLAVDLRTEGLGSVIREMVTPERRQAA
jgi:hypothetical protein